MKRTFRMHFADGGTKDLEITSFSTLPIEFSQSLSLQEKKKGGFHLCVSESLVEDLPTLKNIEIIRE